MSHTNTIVTQGTEKTKSDKCHGQPSISTNDELVSEVCDSAQKYIGLTTYDPQISYSSYHVFLIKDLGMRYP
jgi:hypothetical protein